jgi:hypothetical protein
MLGFGPGTQISETLSILLCLSRACFLLRFVKKIEKINPNQTAARQSYQQHCYKSLLWEVFPLKVPRQKVFLRFRVFLA